MLDPLHLRTLLELGRTGSYSETARRLGYTQPAISHHVRALERAVGAAVVVRRGHRTVLTDVGRTLLPHAEDILRGLAAAEQEVNATVGLQQGRVRVAAFASACATIVAAALAELHRAHPQLEAAIIQAEPERARALLDAGDCDIAVTYDYPDLSRRDDRDDAGSVRLGDDQPFATLAADHPLARRRLLRLTDLLEERWVVGTAETRERLNRVYAALDRQPAVTMASDDIVVVQRLVAHGLGVAVLPRLALVAHHDPEVVTRPVDFLPARRMSLHSWPQMERVPAITAAREALLVAARRIAADG